MKSPTKTLIKIILSVTVTGTYLTATPYIFNHSPLGYITGVMAVIIMWIYLMDLSIKEIDKPVSED